MGADPHRTLGPADDGGPDFRDGTLQEPTEFARCAGENTRDLFEVAAKGQPIVIRGATVLTMRGDERLPNHDIVIRDGVIETVQPMGGAGPQGALEVDGVSKFVTPGFSDIHLHPPLASTAEVFASFLGEGLAAKDIMLPYDLQMFLHLAAGVTRIQPMAGSAEELALRDCVNARRIRGPRMKVASPIVEGLPSMQPPTICWIITSPDAARKAARMIPERGFDFAKPYTRLKREVYLAFVDECHKLGVKVTGHIAKAVGVEDGLSVGRQNVAHMLEFHMNDPLETRGDPKRMAQRAKTCRELGIEVQTTLVASSILEYDMGLAPPGFPIDDILDPSVRLVMRDDSAFLKGWRSDPDMVEKGHGATRYSIEAAQALYAEGVKLLPGTDMGNSNLFGGPSIHTEMRWMVERVGMKPMEVLRASTIACAEHQGEGAIAGTVERGKIANLVVLDADPSVDIANTCSVASVVVGDAVVRKDAMQRGVKRVMDLYAAMPLPQERLGY